MPRFLKQQQHNIQLTMNPTKYIFVTGGVTSSLGKGIIAASLAKLLQARGYRTTIQKFDPYINVDPGTLNPYDTLPVLCLPRCTLRYSEFALVW